MIAIGTVHPDAAASAMTLRGGPAFAVVWNRPSVSNEFGVRGLAGHLGRGSSSYPGCARRRPQIRNRCQFSSSSYDPVRSTEVDAEIDLRIRQGGDAVAADGLDALVCEIAWRSPGNAALCRRKPSIAQFHRRRCVTCQRFSIDLNDGDRRALRRPGTERRGRDTHFHRGYSNRYLICCPGLRSFGVH